jgi:alkylhydroperoxidase family enzyme
LDACCLTAAEKALLQFAIRINDDSHSITRATIETVMQAGWTEPQLAETVHIASLFATFNRVANSFGLSSPQQRSS